MNARVESITDAVPADARVLDLGAVQHDADAADRDDWLHAALLNKAADVTGIDILADEVAVLQDRGYDIQVGGAETFDLDARYDAIVAGELIEHLDNPGAMLARCFEHLRPGGVVVVSTPNPWAFVHVRRAAMDRVRVNPEHTCWFGPRTLRQLMHRHGFVRVRVDFAPPERGVTLLFDRLGFDLLGATHLVAVGYRPASHAEARYELDAGSLEQGYREDSSEVGR